jgi:2-polyprenyl-3-methyl-5-hydroxy-6-metoxy-1,4-benzoquinol methylase
MGESLSVKVNDRKHRVCPVERTGSLDHRIRRWVQDPRKILGAYLQEGMTVLDLGCGPGFFTIDIAQMVGKSGRVIASDLQEGMLQKPKTKIQGTELNERIILYKSGENTTGLSEHVDFILAFYNGSQNPESGKVFQRNKIIAEAEGAGVYSGTTIPCLKNCF